VHSQEWVPDAGKEQTVCRWVGARCWKGVTVIVLGNPVCGAMELRAGAQPGVGAGHWEEQAERR
jgi:hypothetical protein